MKTEFTKMSNEEWRMGDGGWGMGIGQWGMGNWTEKNENGKLKIRQE